MNVFRLAAIKIVVAVWKIVSQVKIISHKRAMCFIAVYKRILNSAPPCTHTMSEIVIFYLRLEVPIGFWLGSKLKLRLE